MANEVELLYNFTKLFFPDKNIEYLEDDDKDILLVNEIFEFVKYYPDQFINLSMIVLAETFKCNLDITNNRSRIIPDIIATVVFIRTMNVLGIMATYDSYVLKVPVGSHYIAGSHDENVSHRIIPEIVIGNIKMNIRGLMPPPSNWRGKWSEVTNEISVMNRELRKKGITANHTKFCPVHNFSRKEKIDMLLCGDISPCKCRVKHCKTEVINYYLAKLIYDLDSSIKGTRRVTKIGLPHQDFYALGQQFLFEGIPKTSDELVYAFAAKVLDVMKNII